MKGPGARTRAAALAGAAILALAAARAPAGGAGASAGRAAGGDGAPEVLLDGAASLRDVLEALAPVCGAQARARIALNLAASNILARQILAGAKADLFFSADEAWMDRVAAAGFVAAGTRRTLLSNRLAVIARPDSGLACSRPADLAGAGVRRLALADPDAVPAGRYARRWLEKAGVWPAVRDRVLPTLDVRAALAAVASGAAEAGVVYRTDAMTSDRVRVIHEVPEADGPAIAYPLAVLRGGPAEEAARRVARCLEGARARPVFERFGFVVVTPPGGAPGERAPARRGGAGR